MFTIQADRWECMQIRKDAYVLNTLQIVGEKHKESIIDTVEKSSLTETYKARIKESFTN